MLYCKLCSFERHAINLFINQLYLFYLFTNVFVAKSVSSSSRSLWISGLASSTRATDLKTLFSKYGKVNVQLRSMFFSSVLFPLDRVYLSVWIVNCISYILNMCCYLLNVQFLMDISNQEYSIKSSGLWKINIAAVWIAGQVFCKHFPVEARMLVLSWCPLTYNFYLTAMLTLSVIWFWKSKFC